MTQERSWWLVLFGDKIIVAALVAIWGIPIFALIQFLIGHAVLGIAIFLAWLPLFWWVVRECDRRQLVRRWFAVASTMVILAPVLVLTVYLMIGQASYAISFDEVRWKNEAESGIRVRMVDDLLRQHPLGGWSQERVDNLLGRPPASDYFKTECDWLYWLGPERQFISIDSEWLCLKFEGTVVSKASLVRD